METGSAGNSSCGQQAQEVVRGMRSAKARLNRYNNFKAWNTALVFTHKEICHLTHLSSLTILKINDSNV